MRDGKTEGSRGIQELVGWMSINLQTLLAGARVSACGDKFHGSAIDRLVIDFRFGLVARIMA